MWLIKEPSGKVIMNKIICTLFTAFLVGSANATPLSLSFGTNDLGGSYQYDFTLTLDNHDNSWVLGNQWDWIIFGDTDFDNNYSGFDVNGGLSGGTDWATLSTSSPISSITTSAGGHNGPALAISSNSVALPGWQPAFVGDSISWSGMSSVYIASDELFWSSLIVGGGANAVYFEQANLATVSEPSIIALIGAGVIGLIGLARRKRS